MTTTAHYTEADLLETWYTQPGESMPVMMHLASCDDCAARYERLEKKLRVAKSCPNEVHEKPEAFWARQRLSIHRKVEQQRAQRSTMASSMRVAAAAVLAFVLGGVVVYETKRPVAPPVQPVTASHVPATVPAVTTPAVEEVTASHDPWQSEELQDFHSVVEWESWVDSNPKNGDSSL